MYCHRVTTQLQLTNISYHITIDSNCNIAGSLAVLLKTRVFCDVTLMLVSEWILTIQRSWCIQPYRPCILSSLKSLTLEHEGLTILRNTCTSPLTQRNSAISHKTRTLYQLFHEAHHLDSYFKEAIISESGFRTYKMKSIKRMTQKGESKLLIIMEHPVRYEATVI